MDMKLIMYSSTATTQSGAAVPAGLCPIVRTCRKNNPNHGITGALYYRYGRYLQIMEGESKKIDQLMTNILKDDRHEKCLIKVETNIKKRTYPKWQCQLSMIIERDPYLRQFLTQYSDELKSMDSEMRVSFNHFFKKDTPKPSNDAAEGPLDIFGCEIMKLTKQPDFSMPGATFLLMNISRLLIEKPHSVSQLVAEYGEDKRDEILVHLKNLNSQGLLQFVDSCNKS